MKLKKIIAAIVGIAVVCGAVAGGIYGYQKYQEDRIVAEVINVSDINYGYFRDAEALYGRLTNDNAQEIYLDGNSKIEEVYVVQGDEVKEGDPLIKYDTREAEIEMRRKILDIDTLRNNLSIAQHELAELRKITPSSDNAATNTDYLENRIDVLEREIDALLDLPQRDSRDNRIYNYITSSTVPFNASTAKGTEDDPYIICCNKSAFVFGNFFRKLDNEWNGKYVQFMVVRKDQNGTMVTTEKEVPSSETGEPAQQKPQRPTETPEISPSSGNGKSTVEAEVIRAATTKITVPVADGSTSPNTVVYTSGNKPTVNHDDDMWYVFTGVQIGTELARLQAELDRIESSEQKNQSSYTTAELREAIGDKEEEVKKIDLQLRQEELKLESLQSATENGIVYAKADGHVKSLGELPAGGDDDDSQDNSTAFMVVTNDDGLYVTASISELLLDLIKPGTTMTANSWETGMTFTATVTEISDYPVENSYGGGEGNSNVSYYAFTAYVADSGSLRNGEYVDLTMNSAEQVQEDSDALFIDNAYVRKEDGKSYCMIEDENGRLKKQYVVTGRSMYGSTEIKAGLLETDRIAFPYGKTAVEGALVKGDSDD